MFSCFRGGEKFIWKCAICNFAEVYQMTYFDMKKYKFVDSRLGCFFDKCKLVFIICEVDNINYYYIIWSVFILKIIVILKKLCVTYKSIQHNWSRTNC